MINKINKICALFVCIFLIFGCSENRFKKNEDINVFSFGFAGYDAYQFCNKIDPRFIDKYPSGRNPSRICIRYQYYTCHIKNYCNGEKSCEEDAAQIWTPLWDNARGNLEKRISITKKVCDIEQKNNSSKKP
jgi:hypothetical protein